MKEEARESKATVEVVEAFKAGEEYHQIVLDFYKKAL